MKNFLTILSDRVRDRNEKQNNIKEIQNFFLRVKEYWYLYDIANGTSHSKLFECLYMRNMKISYSKIAEKFYIGERTLDRYIAKYNDFAVKLIKIDYAEKEVFAKEFK